MIAIRDRFGVKPLYYAVVNGDVFLATEIKALLTLGVPTSWDLEGATGGMGRSHEKAEFARIGTVPPGCYAIARDGDVASIPLGLGDPDCGADAGGHAKRRRDCRRIP